MPREHETKLITCEAKGRPLVRSPRDKPPKAPTPGLRPEDQSNLTDEQSRIMPVVGRDWG